MTKVIVEQISEHNFGLYTEGGGLEAGGFRTAMSAEHFAKQNGYQCVNAFFINSEPEEDMFSLDKLETNLDFTVNSLVLEMADEIATDLTEQECENMGIPCWNDGDGNPADEDTENVVMAEQALDIYNVHYDRYTEQLYKMANRIVKAHSDWSGNN